MTRKPADPPGRHGLPIEQPEGARANAAEFGSDVVAETLRALALPYIALVPGASFRGLHDSLVNYLGNRDPQMLLCLHEEHAVAIAHGYAKVTGQPMAVALHSNVGLFHATMAIFNAWCDRMPVLILGATGPVDAVKRRPWIDWIHTARDQGALVRAYTKWDDQPASAEAAREALLRAAWLAAMPPRGPVYVNLDAALQEARLAEPLAPVDGARFAPQAASAVPKDLIEQAAGLLAAAASPLILAGRVSRDPEAWATRIRLAEALDARVVTDLKVGAAFPTDHPLHLGAPCMIVPDREAFAAIRAADAILSLDWVDLAGTLKSALDGAMPEATILQASIDHQLHNGWSMDHQGLPPVDLLLAAEPDVVATQLAEALGADAKPRTARPAASPARAAPPASAGRLTVEDLALALRRAVGDRQDIACPPAAVVERRELAVSPSARFPRLGWRRRHRRRARNRGRRGAGAQRVGRMVVAVCGDGDFLMGATALWTAVHYGIPLLIVVANNRSFYNDEVHQERVARMRDRPVENKWIGQRIADPDIDLAGLASAQGAGGLGPVERAADLPRILAQALAAVDQGQVAVVDVRVEPGYGAE